MSSILAYLVDSANVTIQNLFYINNGDFSTELDTSQLTDDCLMGDSSGALIREADNINSLALGTAKFKPNLINGTVKICDEDFDRIKDAHKNKLDTFAILVDASECSSPIRSDVAFIHQTGIFDITIICRFDNVSSTTVFDYLLWNIGTGSEHGFTVLFGNTFSTIEGQIHFSLGVPVSSPTTAISVDVRTKLNDGKRHILRFVGSGSLLAFTIDNELIDMITPGFTPGGATNPTRDLFIGSAPIGSFNHIGLYESLLIKNGAGDEIVKFNLTERQGNDIENEGDSAPSSTNASYIVLPSFSDSLNYGYLTMTSPNAKTVSGWLMEIKRNPVDRIAKIKLLERFTNVGIFDGIVYGVLGYHTEFEIDDFRMTIKGTFTSIITSGRLFSVNQNSTSGSQSGISIQITSSTIFISISKTSTTSYTQNTSHGLSLNDEFEIIIRKYDVNFIVTINGNEVISDNGAPTSINYNAGTGNTLIGAAKIIGGILQIWTGEMIKVKLKKLNSSGGFVSELVKIDFNNNNNVIVPNTGSNAPEDSDMIWQS